LIISLAVGIVGFRFGWDVVYRICLVAVGLGLVIFVHELGHFLAAKWCNVHVQTFSLGFGPALPGCSFKWGETTYKIAMFPLGGYVQMIGEGADADEDENYPRSYKNKSVFQRMFIISAGVIMNVIMGFVCFVIVYQFHGIPVPPAAVAAVDAGGPAWKAGLPSGSVFTRIGSATDPNFEDLQDNVALQIVPAPVDFEYKTHGDSQTRRASIMPRRDANDYQPIIGVSSSPSRLQFPAKGPLDQEHYDRPAHHGSAADAARVMDLRPGDVVVAASDPDKDGDPITDLPRDPRRAFDVLCARMRKLGDHELVMKVRRADAAPESGPVQLHVPAKGFEPDDVIDATTDPNHPDEPFNVTTLAKGTGGPGKEYDYYDFQARMIQLAGRPAVLEVLRQSKGPNEQLTSSTVKILVPPAFHRRLGLKMKMGEVSAIRDHSPASDKVQQGDKIVGAAVMEGEKPLGDALDEEHLDPVRLTFELEKRVELASDRSKVKVVLTIRRQDPGALEATDRPVTLDWDDHWRFDQELPFNPASPMAIPELGIAYRVESTAASVEEGSPAGKAGIQPNDRIVEMRFQKAAKSGDGEWGYWLKMAATRTHGGATEEVYDEWPHFFYALQQPDQSGRVQVRVVRNGAQLADIEMTAEEDPTWPLAERGFLLKADSQLDKADNIWQAVGKGVGRTWSFIRKLYQGMVSMVTLRIDPTKNLEGPLNIAKHTFEAAQDIFSLILILGMISVNLAVVNFLPIPVLDGGHMVFLVYELVRRKPPSDAVRAITSYVGLAALGLLMLFVVCLDIWHLWAG
jgi:regulator of sigma E protease